ncbi:MAG: CDGSH iron-sulfur domain-containing protein [Mucinivorans sp.]
MKDEKVKIEVTTGGPIVVKGNFTIICSDLSHFEPTTTQQKYGITICSCTKSATMPFCDGSHKANKVDSNNKSHDK